MQGSPGLWGGGRKCHSVTGHCCITSPPNSVFAVGWPGPLLWPCSAGGLAALTLLPWCLSSSRRPGRILQVAMAAFKEDKPQRAIFIRPPWVSCLLESHGQARFSIRGRGHKMKTPGGVIHWVPLLSPSSTATLGPPLTQAHGAALHCLTWQEPTSKEFTHGGFRTTEHLGIWQKHAKPLCRVRSLQCTGLGTKDVDRRVPPRMSSTQTHRHTPCGEQQCFGQSAVANHGALGHPRHDTPRWAAESLGSHPRTTPTPDTSCRAQVSEGHRQMSARVPLGTDTEGVETRLQL